jgi:hypothetical protein
VRLFRRKTAGGRHALGAAVTAIPSLVPAAMHPADVLPDLASVEAPPLEPAAEPVPAPVMPVPLPVPRAAPAALPAPQPRPAPVRPATTVPTPGPPVAVPPARRVQLGFRDGTCAELDPASEQSHALRELAQSLVRRG